MRHFFAFFSVVFVTLSLGCADPIPQTLVIQVYRQRECDHEVTAPGPVLCNQVSTWLNETDTGEPSKPPGFNIVEEPILADVGPSDGLVPISDKYQDYEGECIMVFDDDTDDYHANQQYFVYYLQPKGYLLTNCKEIICGELPDPSDPDFPYPNNFIHVLDRDETSENRIEQKICLVEYPSSEGGIAGLPSSEEQPTTEEEGEGNYEVPWPH
jgi:hypothetical protein